MPPLFSCCGTGSEPRSGLPGARNCIRLRGGVNASAAFAALTKLSDGANAGAETLNPALRLMVAVAAKLKVEVVEAPIVPSQGRAALRLMVAVAVKLKVEVVQAPIFPAPPLVRCPAASHLPQIQLLHHQHLPPNCPGWAFVFAARFLHLHFPPSRPPPGSSAAPICKTLTNLCPYSTGARFATAMGDGGVGHACSGLRRWNGAGH